MRWSHLVRHGLIGTSLVGAATPAIAGPCVDPIDGPYEADKTWVGLSISVDFAPKLALSGGLEVRTCLSNKVDGVVRLEMGSAGARIVAGARVKPFAGGAYKDEGAAASLGAEATLGLEMVGDFVAQVAAMYSPRYTYLAAQGSFALSDPTKVTRPRRGSIVLGFAPAGLTRESPGVPGRPIRVAGRALAPDVVAFGGTRCAEDLAVRDHLARAAQLEYSSVWTFLRLAAELAAVGAPAELVARALDAADDEVRHAELCARAAGGLALAQLSMSAAQLRFTRRSLHALATLAAEAWSEGCLNEGAAAEEAWLASAEAHGPARSMLATIARDEDGHAALAHDVLAWVHLVAPEVARSAIAVQPENIGARTVEDPALARRGVARSEVRRAAARHARHVAIERVRSVTNG
jgi:hypothetical protein